MALWGSLCHKFGCPNHLVVNWCISQLSSHFSHCSIRVFPKSGYSSCVFCSESYLGKGMQACTQHNIVIVCAAWPRKTKKVSCCGHYAQQCRSDAKPKYDLLMDNSCHSQFSLEAPCEIWPGNKAKIAKHALRHWLCNLKAKLIEQSLSGKVSTKERLQLRILFDWMKRWLAQQSS